MVDEAIIKITVFFLRTLLAVNIDIYFITLSVVCEVAILSGEIRIFFLKGYWYVD